MEIKRRPILGSLIILIAFGLQGVGHAIHRLGEIVEEAGNRIGGE